MRIGTKECGGERGSLGSRIVKKPPGFKYVRCPSAPTGEGSGEALGAEMSKGHQAGDQWKIDGASSVLFYRRHASCVPNCE